MIELRIDKQMTDALLQGDKNPRWAQLEQGAEFIVDRLRAGERADMMFVCTHNSRRSQFAHVWAEVFARSFGLDAVHCCSGGSEVTACNGRTIAALQRVGFEIVSEGEGNPTYTCVYSDKHPPVVCYSSLFSDAGVRDFAAMMCCSDVDEECPVLDDAAIRVALHYDDPKSADGTNEEDSRYDEGCRQIGGDMMLMMSTAANRLDQS